MMNMQPLILKMVFAFNLDERNAQIIAKKQRAVVEVPELGMSRQQLLDLKAVQEERIAAEKLRRIGVTPREDLGVRYDLKLSKARKDDHDDGMQSYLAR